MEALKASFSRRVQLSWKPFEGEIIMRDILIVVDMQNDFIDGALGTGEAVAIVLKALRG